MYKIYRYENLHGEGPYQGGACENAIIRDEFDWHVESLQHPGIYLDSRLKFVSGYHKCAFETVEDLHNWFRPHIRRELSKMGYSVVQYWVTELGATKSGRQVYYAEGDVVHRRVLFT